MGVVERLGVSAWLYTRNITTVQRLVEEELSRGLFSLSYPVMRRGVGATADTEYRLALIGVYAR